MEETVFHLNQLPFVTLQIGITLSQKYWGPAVSLLTVIFAFPQKRGDCVMRSGCSLDPAGAGPTSAGTVWGCHLWNGLQLPV